MSPIPGPSPEAPRGDADRIAGVPLLPVSDGPWRHDDEDLRTPAEQLRWQYERAEWLLQTYGLGHDDDHSRMSRVMLHGEGDYADLHYSFYLTGSLVERFEAAEAEAGRAISQTEMLAIALADTEGTVTPTFTGDAANAANASFYASRIAFLPETRPSPLFINNAALNFALGGMLVDKSEARGRAVRVKELSSGGDAAHWEYAAQGAVAQGADGLHVTLTDFSAAPAVPDTTAPELTIDSEAYSLLETMPVLSTAERFDGIIGEYSFDSVWHPEDMRVVWVNGNACQEVYRLKVPDSHPHREALLAALRAGEPLSDPANVDYRGIFVETALEPIDLSSHPYGTYIERMHDSLGSTNFPGGLIKRVVEAFENQLAPDGVMVSVDVADMGGAGDLSDQLPILSSGSGGRYKVENYWIAKQVLQEMHGLHVELLGFPELSGTYLPAEAAAAFPIDQVDFLSIDQAHVVLVAKRFDSVARKISRTARSV